MSNNKEKKTNLKEILNFNIYKYLNIDKLSKDKQDEFEEEFFGRLVKKIIIKTSMKLDIEDRNKIVKMVNDSNELEEIFSYINEKNSNFKNDVKDAVIDFKEIFYKLSKK